MWRPKDWKCKYLGKKANRYFELGADAMYEALRKQAIIHVDRNAAGGDTITITLNSFIGEIRWGELVLIPKEEE